MADQTPERGNPKHPKMSRISDGRILLLGLLKKKKSSGSTSFNLPDYHIPTEDVQMLGCSTGATTTKLNVKAVPWGESTNPRHGSRSGCGRRRPTSPVSNILQLLVLRRRALLELYISAKKSSNFHPNRKNCASNSF